MYYFFFFQAEDGIRDYKVTGVQTCALPILGAVDDHERGGGVRRRRDAVEIERVVAPRLHGGEHDGQILGPAAGHDGVDRDLLDGGAAVVRRDEPDQLVGPAARRGDRALDAPTGRRHHGQAVGDPARVELLDRI